MFTIREILDLAVQIERNGQRIYEQALGQAPEGEFAPLLKWLAEQEAEHAAWFERLREEIGGSVEDERVAALGRQILGAMLGEQAFSLQETDVPRLRHPEALLEKAIEFENDTILFYELLGALVGEPSLRAGLERIIAEERRHVEAFRERRAVSP